MSITSAPPATLPPRSSGLWILPVLWKTRAIRSASTDAFQKARFPQHLGRRRRRPQAPQALSSYSRSGRQDRISKTRYVTPPKGGELTEHRRYAPMSVHVRRNRCSRSPKYPPASRMKGDAEHRVPLSNAAPDVLEFVRPRRSRAFRPRAGPTSNGAERSASDHRRLRCAVTRRHSSAGANPAPATVAPDSGVAWDRRGGGGGGAGSR